MANTPKGSGKASTLPGVGRIAEQDDIAPEGTVITEEHVLNYRASVDEVTASLGLPPLTWDEA